MVKLKSYSSSNTLLFCPSITFQFRVSPVLTEPDERDQAMALGDTSELSGSVRLLILLFVILRQSLMHPGLVLLPWFWPPTTIYQVLEIQVRGTNTLCCCCLEAGSPSSPAWPKLTTMLLLGLNSQGTLLAQVLRLQVWNSMAHPPLSFLCCFLRKWYIHDYKSRDVPELVSVHARTHIILGVQGQIQNYPFPHHRLWLVSI